MKYGNVPGFKGWGGIMPAIIFMVTGFAGFESAASLAEEAREPRRAVAFAGHRLDPRDRRPLRPRPPYAATVYFGPTRMGGFATSNNGDPWTGMTKQLWGIGWVALFLILVNSLFACANAGTNVSARMLFSLGRSGLLPSRLGRVHGRRQTPFAALLVVMLIALSLSLWLGFQYGPLIGFAILATTSTSFIVSMYILVQLACIAYFWRFQRQHFNWFLHLVVPVAGIALFIPVLLATVGIPVFSFITKLQPPLSYAAYAASGLSALGLAISVHFWPPGPSGSRSSATSCSASPTGTRSAARTRSLKAGRWPWNPSGRDRGRTAVKPRRRDRWDPPAPEDSRARHLAVCDQGYQGRPHPGLVFHRVVHGVPALRGVRQALRDGRAAVAAAVVTGRSSAPRQRMALSSDSGR